MFWPRLRQESKERLALVRFISGFSAFGFWVDLLTAAGIYGLFLIGVFFSPIPFADTSVASTFVKKWWMLDFFNTFVTGTALSRASVFSVGTVSTVFFHMRALTSSRIGSIKETTKAEGLFLGIISVLLISLFVSYGVLELNLVHIVVSWMLLITGSLMLKFLDIKLYEMKFGGFSVLANLIILSDFVTNNAKDGNNLGNVFLIGLILIFFILWYYIAAIKRFIPVWNVSGKDFEKSAFPVPFIDDRMVHSAMGHITLAIFLLFSFLNFFQITAVTPVSGHPIVMLVISLVFVGCFFLYRLPIPFISSFDPEKIALILKSDYWTFENVKPGRETVYFLTHIYKKLEMRSLLFLSFILLLIITATVYFPYLSGESYFFKYGIVGLTILIPNITGFIVGLIRKLSNLGTMRLSEYEWTYGRSAGGMIEILNPIGAKNESLTVEGLLLMAVNSEYEEEARELIKNCKSRGDLIRCLPQLLKYLNADHEHVSFWKGILSFINVSFSVLIISIAIFSIIAILARLFSPEMHLSPNEYFFLIVAFVTFWVGVTISVFFAINPKIIESIKGFLKKRQKKNNQRDITSDIGDL